MTEHSQAVADRDATREALREAFWLLERVEGEWKRAFEAFTRATEALEAEKPL